MPLSCIILKAGVPVEFVVDCRTDRLSSFDESSLSDYFSKNFDVLLRFYPKIDGVNSQANIRGLQPRMDLLKKAVEYFGRMLQTSVVSQNSEHQSSNHILPFVDPYISCSFQFAGICHDEDGDLF